jgi:hypothetical protein
MWTLVIIQLAIKQLFRVHLWRVPPPIETCMVNQSYWIPDSSTETYTSQATGVTLSTMAEDSIWIHNAYLNSDVRWSSVHSEVTFFREGFEARRSFIYRPKIFCSGLQYVVDGVRYDTYRSVLHFDQRRRFIIQQALVRQKDQKCPFDFLVVYWWYFFQTTRQCLLDSFFSLLSHFAGATT